MHKKFENIQLRPRPVFVDERLIAGVDQYDSEDFNMNDCGFVRNDLSQLMRAQSQSEYDALLRKLVDVPSSNSSLPEDMPIEQAIAQVIPRYVQSPSELSMFAESLASRDMRTLDDAYRRALSNKPDSVKTEPQPSADPSE